MPKITDFGPFRLSINTNDHLPPHVHLSINGKSVMKINIEDGEITESFVSGVLSKQVQEYVQKNKAVIMELWKESRPTN